MLKWETEDVGYIQIKDIEMVSKVSPLEILVTSHFLFNIKFKKKQLVITQSEVIFFLWVTSVKYLLLAETWQHVDWVTIEEIS